MADLAFRCDKAVRKLLKRFHIARQAINSQQQWATKRDSPIWLAKVWIAGHISSWTDSTAEPEPCPHHNRHGQPKVATLNFGLDFIRLHLLQVQLALADKMAVQGLAMYPSASPPLLDRALIQAEGFDDSLQWTAISEQDDDAHDDFWVCAQPIEQSAFADGKCLTANGAAAALFLLTMDTEIAFSGSALAGQSILGQNRCFRFIVPPTGFGFCELSSMPNEPVFANFAVFNVQPRFSVVLPLALFLDTNFIFGLLDLSSSPLVDVTKELVRIIQANNLPFKLYYHEKTLEEFLKAIEVVGNRLKGKNWSQNLSRAAIRASEFSGVELEYHKKNAVSPISPDIFLSKFEHAIDLLDSLGFTIYRSSGSNEKLDTERYELTARYGDYIKQNRKRGEKAYEVLNHDIVLWQTVNQLRENGSSVLDARAFVLTIDYYLYSFDWQQLRQDSHVGKVLLPNHFMQILRPFLQVDDDLNKYFVETFAIPEFRATKTDYSTVNSNILSYLNTYREVKEETAIRMLTNTLLKDRLQGKEDDSQEFKDLVDNALVEENSLLLAQIENLTEETQTTKIFAKASRQSRPERKKP